MTGYSRIDSHGQWGRLAWEIRGVNHRYLDIQVKLPEDFRALESDIRARAATKLTRGKVECGMRHQYDASTIASIEIDEGRLQQLLTACQGIAKSLPTSPLLDPLRLLAYPGVVREEPKDFAPVIAAAQTLFAQALEEFVGMRKREGERIENFLLERCDLLENRAMQVRARYQTVKGQWLSRLRQRALDLGVELDPGRLEQEMVLALQRLDVEEEISRLESHLVEVRTSVERTEPVGRRLDFLMQELNREANTLSSKSQDAEMTRHAVEMKVAIEQMREQVQNVE